MSKKPKVIKSQENAQKRVDYEKLKKRNDKLRKELIHHVKIHKESVKLVEEVSEGKFSVEEVRKILKNVDQMFYQDIVEERSGNGCCGYLLCDKSPSNEKQMFRISCNYNKVFDIEERKKFCSDVCFRRSMFILAQIDSSPLWLRDSLKQPEIEFLEDDIGLPGIEIKLEHIAEFSDSEEENDPEKPSNEILQEAVEDLKLYMERTKLEEESEKALEDMAENDSYIKEKKSKAEMKSKTVQITEKFDMKDVMSKFVDRMLRILLTTEALSYLQLATYVQEEDLDSDDEVDLSKFMPKSERKAKIIERNDIPSYEAMTDDMARVQIQEFWNPKMTAKSNMTGTNVDVRKEQEKILLRKIDRFIKPMSLTLKVTEDDIKEELSSLLPKIGIDKDAVCLRPSEAKLVFILLLCLMTNTSPFLLESMMEKTNEINDEYLKEFEINLDFIKLKIREIASEN